MFKTKYRICEMGDGKFIVQQLDFGFIPGWYLDWDYRLSSCWYRFETLAKAEAAIFQKLANDNKESEVHKLAKIRNTVVRTVKKLP